MTASDDGIDLGIRVHLIVNGSWDKRVHLAWEWA